MEGDLLTTSTSSTPLAEFLTFSEVPEMAVRGRAQQQRVRCRALDRRDPSTIIPNTPKPAHALLELCAQPHHSRSLLVCCTRRQALHRWRRLEEQ